MYVVRGIDGKVIKNLDFGSKERRESVYETYEDAERALKTMEVFEPEELLQIVALACERCSGNDDLTIIRVNDESKAYCGHCRVEMFTKKNPVGRPTVGVTKKVSLTLSEDDWYWLDKKAEGNRSKFLREVVWNALSNESEWDNHACLGYAIKGLEELSYSSEEIKKIVRAIYSQFDMTGVPEANKVYRDSDY